MVTAPQPKAPAAGRIRLLDRDQWMDIVEGAAQRELGISAEEFIQRLEAGKFGDADDDPRVMRVAMLLPSAR